MNLDISSYSGDQNSQTLEDARSLRDVTDFADVLRRMPRLLMSDLTLVSAAQFLCERIATADDPESVRVTPPLKDLTHPCSFLFDSRPSLPFLLVD